MRYRDHSALFKCSANGVLYEVISLQIYAGRRFVEYEDLGLAQQRARQTHQLPLTNADGNNNNTTSLFVVTTALQ